jgi:hypothetical protein
LLLLTILLLAPSLFLLQGNMGGNFTHFLMPLVFDGIKASGSPAFQAWRWAFFVPASFQVLLTIRTYPSSPKLTQQL